MLNFIWGTYCRQDVSEGGAIPFASVDHPERCRNTQGTNPLSDQQCFIGYVFGYYCSREIPSKTKAFQRLGGFFGLLHYFLGVYHLV